MAVKLTTLTHKIAIQLLLVAESCTICSSRSRPSGNFWIHPRVTSYVFFCIVLSCEGKCRAMGRCPLPRNPMKRLKGFIISEGHRAKFVKITCDETA